MSISKNVWQYILEHPSIKDCLRNDLINFSSLSRRIAKDLSLKKDDFDAILIACRRYQRKIKSQESENKILDILKKSKIEIKNKICAVVLEKDIYYGHLLILEKEAKREKETFRIIESASAITVITTDELIDKLIKNFKNKLITQNTGLAEITIKSPKEIETIPGAYAYLCSIFWENNINIVETLSCWIDTIFLVDEKEAGKVLSLLRF